jgi:hypothetical protein
MSPGVQARSGKNPDPTAHCGIGTADQHGQSFGVRLRGGRDEREYAMWLLIAEQWAKALGTTGDQL